MRITQKEFFDIYGTKSGPTMTQTGSVGTKILGDNIFIVLVLYCT